MGEPWVPPTTESGCPDLNWGPLRPERSALPGCATPRADKGSGCRRAYPRACSARFCSTSTSRSSGPGRSSGPRGTGASGSGTGSRSIPSATTEARAAAIDDAAGRARPRPRRGGLDRVHGADRARDGRRRRGARACATDMVREWERHENFSLYEDALPVLDDLRQPRPEDRAGLERPARPRGVRRSPRARRRRRGRLEGARAGSSRTRRSSSRRCARSASRPPRRRWSATRTRTTSRGARALGIAAILLDRDGRHRTRSPTGSTRCSRCPAARAGLRL